MEKSVPETIQKSPSADAQSRLERAAARRPPGLLRELWEFLAANKKWWLIPLLLALLSLGALAAFGSGPAAPFIYALF